MGRTNHDKGAYYRYITIILLLVFVLSTVFLFVSIWEKNQSKFPTLEPEDTILEYQGKKYELKKDMETFLVLGLDKFDGTSSGDSYNNDKQSDVLMLFVFDNKAKKYATIHINRDTMAKINVLGVAGNKIGTVTKQIALAHTYGNGKDVSCRNAADAVSDLLLGIDVDHYLSLTMDVVPIYNDFIGGVEVTVLDDFTGIDDTLVKGEKVTLMGEQALTYVRARSGMDDSSNAARMKRQRQYMQQLQKKTQESIVGDEEFIVEATLKLSDYIISDRSVTQLQRLAEKFSTYELLEVGSIEGEYKVGERFMEFYADEDSIKEIVVSLFYEEVN